VELLAALPARCRRWHRACCNSRISIVRSERIELEVSLKFATAIGPRHQSIPTPDSSNGHPSSSIFLPSSDPGTTTNEPRCRHVCDGRSPTNYAANAKRPQSKRGESEGRPSQFNYGHSVEIPLPTIINFRRTATRLSPFGHHPLTRQRNFR
jgi:hypothetical protein